MEVWLWASAIAWTLFSAAALVFGIAERREARKDLSAIVQRSGGPKAIEIAHHQRRAATFYVGVHACFFLVGVAAILVPAVMAVSGIEAVFGIALSEGYSVLVRTLLITGQALLVAKMYSQRRLRKRLRVR